uniref:Uncharacterized protein n=1 Tax=Chromera velia CCMP2878 TaxID=1169474 RepID=A0A0G4I612_9ALVE|eukprot:Cvel_70.t1-p1 / transcript=Cvel_70.t1 / gene=Cvel_70 / organism=Chromera_velia_CCMP2878 / gene_product=hypothetical protein / transcript_product=hypothetical protein / location=Cvel_scaffold6:147957-151234(-) / protein_length=582 / sequence_SO=supercontig / SO=protein_coding / is_pseudo=false
MPAALYPSCPHALSPRPRVQPLLPRGSGGHSTGRGGKDWDTAGERERVKERGSFLERTDLSGDLEDLQEADAREEVYPAPLLTETEEQLSPTPDKLGPLQATEAATPLSPSASPFPSPQLTELSFAAAEEEDTPSEEDPGSPTASEGDPESSGGSGESDGDLIAEESAQTETAQEKENQKESTEDPDSHVVGSSRALEERETDERRETETKDADSRVCPKETRPHRFKKRVCVGMKTSWKHPTPDGSGVDAAHFGMIRRALFRGDVMRARELYVAVEWTEDIPIDMLSLVALHGNATLLREFVREFRDYEARWKTKSTRRTTIPEINLVPPPPPPLKPELTHKKIHEDQPIMEGLFGRHSVLQRQSQSANQPMETGVEKGREAGEAEQSTDPTMKDPKTIKWWGGLWPFAVASVGCVNEQMRIFNHPQCDPWASFRAPPPAEELFEVVTLLREVTYDDPSPLRSVQEIYSMEETLAPEAHLNHWKADDLLPLMIARQSYAASHFFPLLRDMWNPPMGQMDRVAIVSKFGPESLLRSLLRWEAGKEGDETKKPDMVAAWGVMNSALCPRFVVSMPPFILLEPL